MILISFFSEDNFLSDEIKIFYIFTFQSNDNRVFRFFGTPGIRGCMFIMVLIKVASTEKFDKIRVNPRVETLSEK